MSAAFGWAARVAGRRPTSLRVRAAGFTYQPHQPGTQLAWARFCTGEWAAVVDVTLSTANGLHEMPVTLWLPADAVEVAR